LLPGANPANNSTSPVAPGMATKQQSHALKQTNLPSGRAGTRIGESPDSYSYHLIKARPPAQPSKKRIGSISFASFAADDSVHRRNVSSRLRINLLCQDHSLTARD
jgi:hypothetical protein